jgi:uncharacterized protein (DUF924 family)
LRHPEEFLEFWFGPRGGPLGAASRWADKDPAFDALLNERCLDLHREVVLGEHEDWRDQPRPCLAYVVIVDQLSRNMFRGRREAFAHDTLAQAATLGGMHAGFDRGYDSVERRFFYMPLLHAEDRELQEKAILAFATLAEAIPEAERAPVMIQVLSGVKHRNIILRFGRFPHRNAILGRESTAAEIAFLEQPGSSF